MDCLHFTDVPNKLVGIKTDICKTTSNLKSRETKGDIAAWAASPHH